jgi:phosphotransferase system enzyme I (PtsI)
MMEYKGNPVSEGIAVGKVYLYQPYVPQVTEGEIPEGEVPGAIARYETLLEGAKKELEQICRRLEAAGDGDKAKIFTAHTDILFDVAMDEEIRDKITYDFMTPEWAIHKVYEKFIKILGKSKDSLIRERAADLRDVKNRLLRIAAGVPEKNLAALEEPVIVAAHDLLPSDTATLDRKQVLAIVTEVGGATSHSAIIARSYEIPALLGVEGILSCLSHGQEAAVDAIAGLLVTDPSPEQKAEMEKKREAFLLRRAEEKKFLSLPPKMADGTLLPIHLNLGSADARELAGEAYTDGVGLFRTEFIYMGREQLPTEEEQYEIYKQLLTAYGDRPVTLRTLDIGGDKKLQCMELPKEENPFLGNRALRLCFSMPEVFLTQLRAALRASVHGDLWIMFPMVGSLDDIRRAKELLETAKKQLEERGVPYSSTVKTGIMIEIPSIALIADLAAREVDFASIGTNDLTQYSIAVDRMNPALGEYYQSYHPALFRLMGFVIDSFAKEGKPVSVCGEMGGDPWAAAVLAGLGISKLSMGLASVARIKKLLSGLTMEKAQELADKARSLSTSGEVEDYLKAQLEPLLQAP